LDLIIFINLFITIFNYKRKCVSVFLVNAVFGIVVESCVQDLLNTSASTTSGVANLMICNNTIILASIAALVAKDVEECAFVMDGFVAPHNGWPNTQET